MNEDCRNWSSECRKASSDKLASCRTGSKCKPRKTQQLQPLQQRTLPLLQTAKATSPEDVCECAKLSAKFTLLSLAARVGLQEDLTEYEDDEKTLAANVDKLVMALFAISSGHFADQVGMLTASKCTVIHTGAGISTAAKVNCIMIGTVDMSHVAVRFMSLSDS